MLAIWVKETLHLQKSVLMFIASKSIQIRVGGGWEREWIGGRPRFWFYGVAFFGLGGLDGLKIGRFRVLMGAIWAWAGTGIKMLARYL